MRRPSFRSAPRAAVVLAASALLLGACVPAAGRGTVGFVGAAEDVIAEIAALGPNLQPAPQMSFYTIETIGDRSITLVSTSTLAVTLILRSTAQTRLAFSAIQRDGVVQLAASGTGVGAEADVERVLAYLATVFETP